MIHRDLKPENIFISHDYKIKIGDFGLCRQLNSLKSYASTQKGTWNYIAPEMFKENAHYNNKIDIWSLGCIIYELCTLKHCFDFEESGGYIGLSNKILNMEPDKINIKYYSSKLQDLIDSLLKKNYEKRPNINDIYKIILNYYKPEIDFSLYIKEIYFLINKNEKNNNNSYSIINDENNFCLEEVDYSSSSDNNDLEDDYPIGLHLGETSSCIGVFRNCGVEIIPNLNGERTTPSIITILDKNTILKGEETLPYIIKNYDSSIFGTKRFLGREYKDKDLIEEIKKENFPYKIVEDKKAKYPIIFIEKENKKIQFTLEEISSFIIRKMIDNAEAYLGKKVNNVVITVPTNFNDAQRNCTKKAAKLAGVNVLRIINEAYAATLAYSLERSKSLSNKKKKILVFHLGGSTFNVSVLEMNEEENVETMSFCEEFLGGKDFDKKLVEYFLDIFCQKTNESKESIKDDKKAIKELTIRCEIIKRTLSSADEALLYISNFYNNNHIMENITRYKFESLCEDLFDRLELALNKALSDAQISKEEIEEIILIGGTSKIPKVKSFLQEYFNIDIKKNSHASERTRIKDLINPDEAIAYGATLAAAKILYKKDYDYAAFSLFDINPLSLGINIKNNCLNPEMKKEGDIMSLLIKRGTNVFCGEYIERTYQTSEDNQTFVRIFIYEGEKKYIKYNLKLGEVLLTNLPKKKKGEIKVKVNFRIDSEGILSVNAREEKTGKSIEIKILNDAIPLTNEDKERIREKCREICKENGWSNSSLGERGGMERCILKYASSKNNDYFNLKEILKNIKYSYGRIGQDEEDEEKYKIINYYIEFLEEYINFLGNNLDNETIIEKYYFFIKELFLSYIKKENINHRIKKEDENNIINQIKKHLGLFIKQNSGYLDNLVDIFKELKNKKIFFEIIIVIIEELNNCGKTCLEQMKKFCKYNSLIYFEKSIILFKKYIFDFKRLLIICGINLRKRYKKEIALSEYYIRNIKTNAILLCEDIFSLDKLIESKGTGFTQDALGLRINEKDEQENYQIVLSNYEKILIWLNNDKNYKKEEAICLANIIKIIIRFLGSHNNKILFKFGKRCEFIAEQLGINKDEIWYEEFNKNYQKIKDPPREPDWEMRQKYSEFNEIDEKFNKRKNNIDFINYILEVFPYAGYEEDIKKYRNIDFIKESEDYLEYLFERYYRDISNFNYYNYYNNEEYRLKYMLKEYIHSYITNLYNDNFI